MLNDSSDLNVINENMNESLNITREQAFNALNESEIIIEEMFENNFSIVYIP